LVEDRAPRRREKWIMANRVFQGVVYQMKEAIDRTIGVVDETGVVIACSDLNRVGEMREGVIG